MQQKWCSLHEDIYIYVQKRNQVDKVQLDIDSILIALNSEMSCRAALKDIKAELYKQLLREISSILFRMTYQEDLQLFESSNMVGLSSLIQHILYSSEIGLTERVKCQLNDYLVNMLQTMRIASIQELQEQASSSIILRYFNENILSSVIMARTEQVCSWFCLRNAVSQKSILLILLDLVIKFQHPYKQQTLQWFMICFVYLIYMLKFKHIKKTPIFCSIVGRYQEINHKINRLKPQFNLLELVEFYNGIVLPLFQKIDANQSQMLLEKIEITNYDNLEKLIIKPIDQEDNTVLDNIMFSSSLQA